MFQIGDQSFRPQNVFTQGSSSLALALFSFSSLQLFFYLLLISQAPFISASPSCPHLLSVLIPPLLLCLLFCCSFKAFSFSPIPKVSPSGSLRTHAKIYIKTYESFVFLNILLHTRWYCDLPHTEIGCGSIDL